MDSLDMTAPAHATFAASTEPQQETLPLDAETAPETATEDASEPQEATFQAATEPVDAAPTGDVSEGVSEVSSVESRPSDDELVKLVTETHAMVKDMHTAFTEIAPSLVAMTESLSKGGLMGMMGKMFG